MENHERSWRVVFDRASTSITCSCRKFDTFGILCSHALKVFESNDVKVIPEKYILRRWTREARCGIVQDFRGKQVEGDPKLTRNRMFRQVVSKFIKLATEASSSEECLNFVDDGVDDMFKKMMEARAQAIDNDGDNSDQPGFMSYDAMLPKGFKMRLGSKGNKRYRSWIERQPKQKKTHPSRPAPTRRRSSQDKELTTHMFDGVSCSAPPTYEPALPREDQVSYTSMLMAPLDDTNIGALL